MNVDSDKPALNDKEREMEHHRQVSDEALEADGRTLQRPTTQEMPNDPSPDTQHERRDGNKSALAELIASAHDIHTSFLGAPIDKEPSSSTPKDCEEDKNTAMVQNTTTQLKAKCADDNELTEMAKIIEGYYGELCEIENILNLNDTSDQIFPTRHLVE